MNDWPMLESLFISKFIITPDWNEIGDEGLSVILNKFKDNLKSLWICKIF